MTSGIQALSVKIWEQRKFATDLQVRARAREKRE